MRERGGGADPEDESSEEFWRGEVEGEERGRELERDRGEESLALVSAERDKAPPLLRLGLVL